jgi:mannose-6-phosphate isomerase-like protein (cupin superfamily)
LTGPAEPRLIDVESLRRSPTAALFEGARFGGVGASSFILTHAPGVGPPLHVHPYPEVFILLGGEATFQIGDQVMVVRGGQIAIAPGGTPHRFTNTGAEPLSMVSIHPSDHVIQENLDAAGQNTPR